MYEFSHTEKGFEREPRGIKDLLAFSVRSGCSPALPENELGANSTYDLSDSTFWEFMNDSKSFI